MRLVWLDNARKTRQRTSNQTPEASSVGDDVPPREGTSAPLASRSSMAPVYVAITGSGACVATRTRRPTMAGGGRYATGRVVLLQVRSDESAGQAPSPGGSTP